MTRPVAGLPKSRSALFRLFESLGDNCEFGLVQRHFGVEQPGLLKWGASRDGFPGLCRALDARLVGAGSEVSHYMEGSEYISVDTTYDLIFHTDRHDPQLDIEAFYRNERSRIGYLARNLIEDLEEAEKIFVYKRNDVHDLETVDALYRILNKFGPVWLLWVVQTDDLSGVGSVEHLGGRLLKGHIDRFSPYEAVHSYCSFDIWEVICRRAFTLRRRLEASDLPAVSDDGRPKELLRDSGFPLLPDSVDALLWPSLRAGEESAWHGHVSFAHWIVQALSPATIVELGTHNGVSYAAFCNAIERCSLDTKCFGVDIWSDAAFANLAAFNKANFNHFSTLLNCHFDEAAQHFPDGSVDLLHIDGLHGYEAVSHDFDTWLPKLSDRAVVLFHDTTIHEQGFEVWKLWGELVRRYPSFSFRHAGGWACSA